MLNSNEQRKGNIDWGKIFAENLNTSTEIYSVLQKTAWNLFVDQSKNILNVRTGTKKSAIITEIIIEARSTDLHILTAGLVLTISSSNGAATTETINFNDLDMNGIGRVNRIVLDSIGGFTVEDNITASRSGGVMFGEGGDLNVYVIGFNLDRTAADIPVVGG